ncbi:MAG: SPFH domain-containing protein [Anaerolineales bacterium]|nr:SPFH domain-containing protein [Anaerolineales bacterium]
MRRGRPAPVSPTLPVSRGGFLAIMVILLLMYWVMAHYLERVDLTASLNGWWQARLPGAPPLPVPFVTLVEFFHPRVLRNFIPVIAGWVLAYLAAVSLVRVLYDLPDSGIARSFLGRLVGEAAQGPATAVSSKTLAKLRETSELLRVGGPGMVVIPAGEAAVTEVNGRFYRIIPPGKHKIGRFEYIHTLVDLRPQERHLSDVVLLTRDGIDLTADITLSFRIETGGTAPTRDNPFPYSSEAVRLAAYSEIDRGDDLLFTWQDIPGNIARGVLAGIVLRFRLDELLHPEGRRDPYLTLNQELERLLRNSLEDVGIELLSAHIGRLEMEPEVAQQYIDFWRADLDARAQLTLAEGQANSLAEMEIARAEAELVMIQAILEGLENARRAGGAGTVREVVALRMIEALERLARQSEPLQTLPATLLPQLTSWQQQLRADRRLPARGQKDQ